MEAYDLTGSLRAAAKLAGCDHKTVAHWVRQRELAATMTPVVERRRPAMGELFKAKIDELVERSGGRIRADIAHDKLVALGYEGSSRTTRRWVAEAKLAYRREHGRRTRPWIPEPGLWMQWDYGDGPVIGDRRVVLFCAWLAWSRYRVVVPLWDKTLPSVVLGLDRAFRYFDGVPTYALTDNEKTVSVDHIAGIAVRNSQIVGVGHHYGVQVQTCVPADPQSKGGSEATVRVAKADLVPTDHNLLPAYRSMGELEDACLQWMSDVNTRKHRCTQEPPVLRLAEEHERLHRVPARAHTVVFGETRKVNWQSTVSVGGAVYSVPHQFVDQRVWVRVAGDELIVVATDGPAGAREIARHALTTPGRPSIQDDHYPPRPAGALERRPKARGQDEKQFLQIGLGAEVWLRRAAGDGTARLRTKIAEAIDLAKIHGNDTVNHALQVCAQAGRFADGDLARIIVHHQRAGGELLMFPSRSEDNSLQASTKAWEGLGR
ncbi:MAG TPA: IS21 family transposase [Solirubrobacteraceae bacterium]|nr:IS21 family transposase [Solirubrobacteraceae bacterium]